MICMIYIFFGNLDNTTIQSYKRSSFHHNELKIVLPKDYLKMHSILYA